MFLYLSFAIHLVAPQLCELIFYLLKVHWLCLRNQCYFLELIFKNQLFVLDSNGFSLDYCSVFEGLVP